MENTKLISMVDYVIQSYDKIDSVEENLQAILNYANFLKQPLTIGMFVPTDLDGKVLEPYVKTEAETACDDNAVCVVFSKEEVEYGKAKSRVLFEGFEKCTRNEFVNCVYNKELDLHIGADFKPTETIGGLTKYKLTLTQTAINNLNGK